MNHPIDFSQFFFVEACIHVLVNKTGKMIQIVCFELIPQWIIISFKSVNKLLKRVILEGEYETDNNRKIIDPSSPFREQVFGSIHNCNLLEVVKNMVHSTNC